MTDDHLAGESAAPADWWEQVVERVADPAVAEEFAAAMARIDNAEQKADAVIRLLDLGVRMDLLAEADESLRVSEGRVAELEAVLERIQGMEHDRCHDCPACIAHKTLRGHWPNDSPRCCRVATSGRQLQGEAAADGGSK